MAGAEVEVMSSRAPSFRARTNTDSQGRYVFPNVPCGGKIILRAIKHGNQVGQGVGEMYDGQGSVTINLRPVASGPPKN